MSVSSDQSHFVSAGRTPARHIQLTLSRNTGSADEAILHLLSPTEAARLHRELTSLLAVDLKSLDTEAPAEGDEAAGSDTEEVQAQEAPTVASLLARIEALEVFASKLAVRLTNAEYAVIDDKSTIRFLENRVCSLEVKP